MEECWTTMVAHLFLAAVQSQQRELLDCVVGTSILHLLQLHLEVQYVGRPNAWQKCCPPRGWEVAHCCAVQWG